MLILAQWAGAEILVLDLDRSDADRIRTIVERVASALSDPDVVAVTTKMTISGTVIPDDEVPEDLLKPPFSAAAVPVDRIAAIELLVEDVDEAFDARHIDSLQLVVGSAGFWFVEENYDEESNGLECSVIPLSVLGA